MKKKRMLVIVNGGQESALANRAAGLPVITAPSAGGAELVRDAGIVIPDPEDIHSLADALRCLATDAKLRDAKGIQARGVAIGLSTAQMTQKYPHFYGNFP